MNAFSTVTPSINQTSQSLDAFLAMEVTLCCLATGYPVPEIKWQKNSLNIDLDDLNQEGSTSDIGQSHSLGMRLQILSFSVVNFTENTQSGMHMGLEDFSALGDLGVASMLIFTELRREDTANYTCIASNNLPATQGLFTKSAPISITVLGMWQQYFRIM